MLCVESQSDYQKFNIQYLVFNEMNYVVLKLAIKERESRNTYTSWKIERNKKQIK